MSEWWTYRLSDFLMFAPRTYYRLHELHNQGLWPAQVAALLVALVLAHAVWRGRMRLAWLLLAAGAAAVAGGFMLQRLASIHWAGTGWAVAFAAQALLLVLLAWAHPAAGVPVGGRGPVRGALVLVVFTVLGALVEPLALGREWRQAAVVGLAPDPTAMGVLAVLAVGAPLTRGGRWLHALAWGVPLAWCLFSAATLWSMQAPEAVGRVLLPACALALMLYARRTRPRSCG